MKRKQFPTYFDNEEEQKIFEEFAKERGLSLNSLIKQALYAVREHPDILNPAKDKANLDVLLAVLEKRANERVDHTQKFEESILSRLDKIEGDLELIMNKQKIPKSKRKKGKRENEFDRVIFDD